METKANYLMIGGFVLGALAFAFVFIFWITNFADGGKRYLIVFEGSVAGLTSGSSVSFNGIKIGEVQTFALDPTDGRKVQVVVGLSEDTPVRENSRAKITSFGLTGGKGVEITPGTPDSPLLVATDEDPIPTIQAARGATGGLFDAAPAALDSANAFLRRLDELVAANEQAINSTMTNVDEFTTMLNSKDEEISQTIRELNEGAKAFSELGSKLDSNVDVLTQQAKQGMQDFSSAMQEARRAAVTLNRILEKFESSPTGFLLRGGKPPEQGQRGFGESAPGR
jgi:phospholipid/cholesterol/gamma-HCH transport system substrate-binding protein